MSRPWRLLLKILLVLACLYYLVFSLKALGPGAVWAVARECHLGWLFLSLIPLFARFIIWSWKWHLMVYRQAKLGFGLAHRLIMAAAFINLVTPTAKLGGAVFRAFYLKQRLGFRASRAYGWVFADQMGHLLGNMFLFGVVALCSPFILPTIQPQALLLIVGVTCIGLTLLFVNCRPWLWKSARRMGFPKVLRQWLMRRMANLRESRTNDSVPQFLWPWLASGKNRQIWGVEVGLSGLSFAMLGIANAWVLTSLGAEARLIPVLLVVMLAYLGGSFLGIMGGIGVTEVFLLKLYPLIGISQTHAAAGALLHRALFYALVLLAGGWAFFMTRRRNSCELVNVA